MRSSASTYRSTRSVALGVAWRMLHNVFTTKAILFPSMIFPLVFFAAFAGGLSQVSRVPGFEYASGYTAFQFAFVCLQSAMFGGVFTGFGIARDFEGGFARRLLLAAQHRSGILLGYAIASLARWAFTVALVTVLALAVGMEVGGSGVDLVGLYTLAALANVAAALWAAGLAMRFRTMQAGPVIQLPVFLALFFAPVYVPLDLLRGWIQTLAVVNPITRLLEASRSLLDGHPSEVAPAFGVVLALIALFAIWAVRGLRRAERAAV